MRMPPRRRPPAAGASSTAASTSKPTGARPSKLAKEHSLTAQEESEIREAFSLFSEPMEGEKQGVMPIGDVRRALIALGVPPSSPAQLATFTAALDPSDEGFTTYPAFLSVCALQLHARRQDESLEAHQAELDEAYALFAGGDPDAPAITLACLKRVAALLRLDQPSVAGTAAGKGDKDGDRVVVTEEVLRDMILEANGGAGVGRGVRKEEFDGVMRRAGVWR
ncbi:hypothetical protein N657DRAFT_231091 [Parathielavia appendiculata]|uniref:Calmodulin n=1 Tax=Parathielavia appendiculata TaxID=2587402 RepID=A0AAN6Z7F3_9PEZI|nr:hypothetical protein N657DRAFT_231091 [Parathielavia appendiculata]